MPAPTLVLLTLLPSVESRVKQAQIVFFLVKLYPLTAHYGFKDTKGVRRTAPRVSLLVEEIMYSMNSSRNDSMLKSRPSRMNQLCNLSLGRS